MGKGINYGLFEIHQLAGLRGYTDNRATVCRLWRKFQMCTRCMCHSAQQNFVCGFQRHLYGV